MLFSSVFVGKIVGLELIGVLQLAYFVLAQQENVNIMLEPFMKLGQMNGVNINLIKNEKKNMPDTISSLGYNAQFLNNCNTMLLLVYAEVSVAIVLYAFSHMIKRYATKLSKFSKYLIK